MWIKLWLLYYGIGVSIGVMALMQEEIRSSVIQRISEDETLRILPLWLAMALMRYTIGRFWLPARAAEYLDDDDM